MGDNSLEGVIDEAQYVRRVDSFQKTDNWMIEAEKLILHIEAGSGSLRGSKVMDFGCGAGRLCRMLAQRGARVTGVDSSDAMLERAKAYDNTAYGEISYRLLGQMQRPAHGQFDFAICMHVLGHVPDPLLTLMHLRYCLARWGRVVVLNPNKVHTLLRRPYNRFRGFAPDPTIRHRFTKNELVRLAERASFKLEWSYSSGESFLGAQSLIAASFIKS